MIPPVAGKLAAAPVEDKVISAIPALHHIQTVLDLLSEFNRMQITTEEDRLERSTQFCQSSIGWMPGLTAIELPGVA